MSGKSYAIPCVAAIVACLAASAPAVSRAGDTEAGVAATQRQDGAPTLTGRLVRIDGDASCERPSSNAVDVNTLHTAIETQLAHLARLAAEYRGLDQITTPHEWQNQENDPQYAVALREEQDLFNERKAAMASQIDALSKGKELEEREVEYTKAKQTAVERQVGVLQKEFDNISGLVNRGMAVNSQKLGLEQSLLQSEGNLLDIKLLVLKAQQEVSRIDRNMADLRSQWRNEAVSEFNKGQQTLSTLLQQAQAATGATGGSDPTSLHDKARCDEARGASYLLVRGSNGVLQAFPVASRK